jgi:hypothetical protein
MLYVSTLVALLLTRIARSDVPPQTLVRGEGWTDFELCDHGNWRFGNENPIVHAQHRDGGEDMIEYCYYGEWSGGNDDTDNDNLFGESQWQALDFNAIDPFEDFDLRVQARLWAFCDWEPNDQYSVYIRDQWIDEGIDGDDPTDDNWGRTRTLITLDKNRNNCNNWDSELNGSNEPDWLDEVECTNGNNGVSCYLNIDEIMSIDGSRFGIRFEADLNNGENNEAYAWSDIKLHVDPENDISGPCCTGTRNDKPSKSCNAFGEQQNCQNKGCQWNIDAMKCQINCCRKIDSSSKIKPKCKTLTNSLEQLCGVDPRGDCDLRYCNCNGYRDGLNMPEGEPCPPDL